MTRKFFLPLMILSWFLSACSSNVKISADNLKAESYLQEDYDSTIFYAEKNLRTYSKDHFHSYYLIAAAEIKKKDYKSATVSFLKSLQSIPKNSENDAYRADILFNIGKIFKLHTNYQQAIKYYKLSESYASEQDLSSIYYNLANAYKKNNQPDTAAHYYTKSLRKAYHAEDEIRQAKVYLQLGLVYKAMGNIEEARSRWLTIVNNDRDTSATYAKYRGKALHNLGDIHLQAGEYKEALQYFKQALAVKIQPTNQFNTLLNLGLTYDAMEQPARAHPFYERAESYYPLVDTYAEYIELFHYMDFSYRETGDYELSKAAALRFYEENTKFNATKQAQISQYQAHRVEESIAGYESWVAYQETIRQYRYAIIAGILFFISLIVFGIPKLIKLIKTKRRHEEVLDGLREILLDTEKVVNNKAVE